MFSKLAIVISEIIFVTAAVIFSGLIIFDNTIVSTLKNALCGKSDISRLMASIR